MFARWAKLMGEDHWLTDPRFKDDLARGDNGEIISKRMSEWTAERTTERGSGRAGEGQGAGRAALYAAAGAGGRAHPGRRPARGQRLPGTAAPGAAGADARSISPRRPGASVTAPRMLGEHTDAILKELGYGEGDIKDFRARGVI